MKATRKNGMIIIEFEEEVQSTDRIIAMLKEREEMHRRAAEAARAFGCVGTAAIDEIRADTTCQIIKDIEKVFTK